MSSLVEFSMPFDYTLATTYFIAGEGMTLNDSVYGVNATFGTKTSGSRAWATLNNTAKGKLFPNSTAHPVSMSYAFSSSRPVVIGASAHALYLQIDGEPIANTYGTTTSHAWVRGTDVVNAAITGATKSSTIRFGLETSNKLYRAMGCSESDSGYFLSFKFRRYDFTASAGTGIASAAVSSANGYDGDNITFSCQLESGAVFNGWYSGSTLVSTSLTYTHAVSGSDMSLTAKATVTTSTLTASYGGRTILSVSGLSGNQTVGYNGQTIATLAVGSRKTLNCSGKVMKTDITVAGKALLCAGKIMTTNVEIYYGG